MSSPHDSRKETPSAGVGKLSWEDDEGESANDRVILDMLTPVSASASLGNVESRLDRLRGRSRAMGPSLASDLGNIEGYDEGREASRASREEEALRVRFEAMRLHEDEVREEERERQIRDELSTLQLDIEEKRSEVERMRYSGGEEDSERQRARSRARDSDWRSPGRRATGVRRRTHSERQVGSPEAVSRTHMKPQQFTGEDSLLDYNAHFAVMARLNGWNYREKGLWLASSLKGTAQQVLTTLPVTDQTDYDALVGALERRFQPPNQTQMYRARLRAVTRKDGEDLTAVAESIKRLVMCAYPTADLAMQGQLAKDAFVDALVKDRGLVWHIRSGRPVDLDEAVQVGLEYEAFRKADVTTLGEGKGGARGDSAPESPSILKRAEPEVEALHYRIKELEQLIAVRERVRRAPERIERGSPQRSEAPTRVQFQENSPRGPPTTCWTCGKVGHMARDCRAPRTAFKGTDMGPSGVCTRSRSARLAWRPQDAGLYAHGHIFGQEVYCLVDTGATASVMSPDFVKLVKGRGLQVEAFDYVLTVGNGEEVPVTGIAKATLQLNGINFNQEFLIAPVNNGVILGLDFLRAQKAVVETWCNVMAVRGQRIQLVLEGKIGVHRATVVKRVVLGPRQERVIWARLVIYIRTRKPGLTRD